MAELVQTVRVVNELGLHTRPATSIAMLLQHSKSDVSFTCKKKTVNAKSILQILLLAAQKNSLITITVNGDDAESTMQELIKAFSSGFGEATG